MASNFFGGRGGVTEFFCYFPKVNVKRLKRRALFCFEKGDTRGS
jgi:hypothetical protein